MGNNLDKDIEILKEFKEKGFASLMIKYNKNRIQTNTMVKMAIENVIKELERYKQYYEEQNEVNKVFVPKATFDMVNAELETWKNIAEKLAEIINNHDIDEDVCRQMGKDFDCTLFNQHEKFCVQCIIDWARKEVEK